MSGRRATGEAPRVTVVIPTRSRPGPLRGCLAALARLDHDFTSEVVVVDDGSPVGLAGEVEACASAGGARLIRQAPAGPAAARNRGAAAARGTTLVFLDDDCRPQAGWLAALVREVGRGGRLLVGGPTINGAPGNLYAEATQLLVDYVSHHSVSGRAATEFLPSCNLAVSKDSFEQLGGFDEAFAAAAGEDRELCARGLQLGFEIRFVDDAVVHHFHHLTLRTYLRQHLTYGRGAVLYRRRCATNGQPAARAAPRWYLGLVAHAFRRHGPLQGVPLSALLVLAQMATAIGAVTMTARRAAPATPGE